MASPVDTSVKFMNETMPGAPVLSGTAGALISVLDALLVTGFGLRTAVSVVVVGGVATVTLSSDAKNANLLHSVILVDGVAAPMAALNGEQRVTAASSTTLQFATAVADGTATGTITIKSAPVGWEKKFSGTNKAVYRSTDPAGSGFCLRVDDAGTTSARVRGFESMTDVDTGSGPFPTDAQANGGGYQPKSYAANANAARYDIAADSRMVLLAVGAGASSNATWISSPMRGFGDTIALAPGGDGFAVVCSCSFFNDVQNNYFAFGAMDNWAQGTAGVYMARALSGIGGSQYTGVRPYAGSANAVSGADLTMGSFPSVVDGELKYSRRYVSASSDNTAPRAIVPGLLSIPQSGVFGPLSPRDTLNGTGDMAGRTLLALATNNAGQSTVPAGIYLVDITGPWR